MRVGRTILALGAPAAAAALLLAQQGAVAAAGGNPERGQAIYQQDCAKCHGKTGAGDGRAGHSLEHKPTAFSDKSKLSPDDKLFKAIKDGGKAVGESAEMEAYPQYSDEQISDLVAYIKTLAK